jgi:hypothetical protein
VVGVLLKTSLDQSLAAIEAALADVRLTTTPFPHFVLPNLFDDATAESVLHWLEDDAPWAIESRGFYLHHGCSNLAPLVAGSPAAVVAAPETFRLMRQHLERIFGVALSGDHFEVAAHRMLPGHRIRVHTDSPNHGTETHRFLINLNSQFDDAHGGHLVLLDMHAPDESAIIVRPLHNSAVAMEFSDHSWHCVDEIRAGKRYSLVYSFWREHPEARAGDGVAVESEAGESVAGESQGLSEDEFSELVALLREHGANTVPHSNLYLIDHLQGTYRILKGWGCDRDVCKAGLFHSVLGTPSFPRPLVGDDRVDAIREAIGDRALLLVRLFSRMDWQSLLRILSGESLSDGGEPVSLGTRDRHALASLTWANVLEQSARVPLSNEARVELRELYEQTARALPTRAQEEIRKMLAASEIPLERM